MTDRKTLFDLICAANETLKTLNIKGKDYVSVNERIKAFRYVFPLGTISTEILEDDGERVTVKAYVYDGGTLLATGHAFEVKAASYINKTSYIENCETSAVGRALGFFGIGIDASMASAEELVNALVGQEEIKARETASTRIGSKRAEALEMMLAEKNVNVKALMNQYGVDELAKLTEKQHADIVRRLNK